MITGIIRSAEEITGQKGCRSFVGDRFIYTKEMNSCAGKRIVLKPWKCVPFDYLGKGRPWCKNWLKDIREEEEWVDWSKVAIDAEIEVSDNIGSMIWQRRHFAGIDSARRPLAWERGGTSYTILECRPWRYTRLFKKYVAEE